MLHGVSLEIIYTPFDLTSCDFVDLVLNEEVDERYESSEEGRG